MKEGLAGEGGLTVIVGGGADEFLDLHIHTRTGSVP